MVGILRQRNFSLLWFAGFISLMGDWVLYAAFPFYVAKVTGSPLATGAMALTELLPNLLLGTVVGVFIDRWSPKATMIRADILRAMILLLLFAMQSSHSFWLIYVVAFIESSISVFFGPSKVMMIKRIVKSDDLVSANSLSSISDNACRLLGPIIAGGLFLFFGLHILVLLDCASYVFSAILVAGITLKVTLPQETEKATLLSEPPVKKRSSLAGFWHQWLQGFHYLYHERWLLVLCLCMAASMLGQGIFNALLPIFAEQVVRMNSEIYGWYLSVQGVGGLIGGFLIGRFGKRLHPIQLLAGSLGITSLLMLLQNNFPFVPIVLVTATIVGIFVVGWIVGLQTVFQRDVDEAYLGRIISTYGTIQIGALLIGTSSGSLLGSIWGIVPTLNIADCLLLLASVGCLLFRTVLEKEEVKKRESLLEEVRDS